MQKPDSNRPVTPYEGAAFPVEPFCIIIAGTGPTRSSGPRLLAGAGAQWAPLSTDRAGRRDPERSGDLEPATFCLTGSCCHQLSYVPKTQLPSGESELQESNLRLLFVRQRPSHWTKPHYFLRSLPECCPQADLQQIHDPIHLVRGAREACLRGARAILYGFEPLFQFGRLTLNQ